MRALVVAAVLASLVLAGCADPDAYEVEPDTPDPPGQEGLAFIGPTLVGGGGHPAVGETSLAIGPNGELLTCTVETPIVYASLDGGQTWTGADPFDGSWNGDCDVAIADDGTWVVVFSKPSAYYDLPTAPTVSEIATSTDGGATWTKLTATRSPVQCPHTVNSWVTCALHRPWLHTEGERVDLTYQDLLPTVVLFQRSTDSASTWSDPTVAAADPGHGASGRMVQSLDGQQVLIPAYYTEPTLSADGELQEGPSRVVVVESTDSGTTWTEHIVASDALDGLWLKYGMPSVVALDGTWYVAAALDNGTAADAVLFTSEDGGASWSSPHLLAPDIDFGGDGRGHFKVLLDVGPEGLVAAWYHRDASTGWRVDFAGLDGGEVQWNRSSPAMGGEDLHIEFFDMRHDDAGNLHVMLPVPEERCADEGPHCLWHLALTPP